MAGTHDGLRNPLHRLPSSDLSRSNVAHVADVADFRGDRERHVEEFEEYVV